ncbi:hypothetical protein GOV09_01780 [Candidatus Woesearchaeota archaeon]|nr:hypothetical protein [Candidatus Woesearchaeota archaeon]
MSHETAIAKGIIDEAMKHGSVKEISLEIGQLAHVPGHELIECLERMIDWKINHEERKAMVKCKCGFEGPPTILDRGHDFFMIECPKCKAVPELTDGTEIKILNVVID